MLKFWNSETYITAATGTSESYLVYQDDDIPHKFYIVPNRPTIGLTEGNKLAFNFIKYRFKAKPTPSEKAEQAKKGGGYVVFDVVLRVPDAAKTDILGQIQERYKTRLARAALAQENAAKKPSDAKLAATAAAALKLTDGVLDSGQIQIAPVPFQTGSVKLNIQKDANSPFVQTVTTIGKPSKDGNNTASFSIFLTDEGATLFEHALSGKSGGAVQVFYEVKTWFRSSDTVIIASYDKSKALSYGETITHDKKIWSDTKINKEFYESIREKGIVNVDIKWGDGTYTKEQEAELRNWATTAVAEAIKQKVADLTKVESSTEVGKRAYDLSTTFDFSQTYRESFAMLMELAPQGMLPSINAIADPAGGTFKWEDYYREVDLDDPFFNTLRLGVSTDLDFTKGTVSRLTVDLWADSKSTDGATREQHTTLSFSKDESERKTWDPFVSGDSYDYQYSIYFKGGATPFTSKRVKSVSKEAVIGSSADGILNLDVVSAGISFDLVSQVVVIIQPFDPTTKRKGTAHRTILEKATPGTTVTIPVGGGLAAPYAYEYQLEYIFVNDNLVIKPKPSVVTDGSSQISVPPPFPSFRTVNLTALSLKEGDSVFVDLFYSEPNGYSHRGSIALDSDNPGGNWVVGVKEGNGELTYKAVFDFADGTSAEQSLTKAKSDLIRLSATNAQDGNLTIEVDPGMIDWDTYNLQAVELVVTAAGRTQRMLFRVNKLPDELPKLVWVLDGAKPSYTWKAVYTMKVNGKIVRHESPEQTSEDVYLPLPDPEITAAP